MSARSMMARRVRRYPQLVRVACARLASACRWRHLWRRRQGAADRAWAASSRLRLRDLFKNAAFGLYADRDERDGSDQISESEGVQGPAAEAVSEHEAHHR